MRTAMGLVLSWQNPQRKLAFSGSDITASTATPALCERRKRVAGGHPRGPRLLSLSGLAAGGDRPPDTGGSVRVPAAWNESGGAETTSAVCRLLKGVVALGRQVRYPLGRFGGP